MCKGSNLRENQSEHTKLHHCSYIILSKLQHILSLKQYGYVPRTRQPTSMQRGNKFCDRSFHKLFLLAWLADEDSLKCYCPPWEACKEILNHSDTTFVSVALTVVHQDLDSITIWGAQSSNNLGNVPGMVLHDLSGGQYIVMIGKADC